MRNAVRIDVSDNVATVLRDVSEQERIGWDEGSGLVARESIPEGHKVALVAPSPAGGGRVILLQGEKSITLEVGAESSER